MKKEKGIALINFILLILIAVVAGILFFIHIGKDLSNQYDNMRASTNSTDLLREYEEEVNIKDKNTNKIKNGEDSYSNVSLNNSILESGTQSMVFAKKYFYNQLNDISKSIYNTILNNVDSLKNGYQIIRFSDLTEGGVEENFQSAWDAFELDNPQIFYIDTKKISLITKTTKTIFGVVNYEYQLQPKDDDNYYNSFWSTELEVQDSINQIDKIVDNIKEYCTGTTYDKVKFAHDCIVENCEYDEFNGVNANTIYGLFVEKKAVCEGYAKAFKVIMDKINIPCVVVYGNGTSDDGTTEYHAWCYVQMDDGNWYAVDTTWDDPIIIGTGTISNESKYRYFLRGSNTFSKNHVSVADVSGTGQNFKYPTLSETDYKK